MRVLSALFLTFLVSTVLLAQGPANTVRLADRTDWWSVLNENFEWPNDKTKGEELAAANFEIAGVNIQSDMPFRDLKNRFGRAISAARSKGMNGREQVCYESAKDSPVRLVFEQGESSQAVYLFVGGQPWNGQALCVESSQVTPAMRTKSGLGLGMSPAEVEQVLGKADFSRPDRLVYYRDIEKRTPEDKLAQLRAEHSDLAEQEFRDNYGSYDLELYIDVRFTEGKATYLAVSKGESY